MSEHDMIFNYPGYHGIKSKCRLRIWIRGRINASAIVVMSDVPDGGTSITNRSEVIASKVVTDILLPKHEISHTRAIWFEHYPHAEKLFPEDHETFDLVTYEWDIPNKSTIRARNPSWYRVSLEVVEGLVKEEINDYA